MKNIYEIQYCTVCDGWVNTWTIDGKPETFETYNLAAAALDDFLEEIEDDIVTGERPREFGYDREDFRIHKIWTRTL